MILLIKFVIIDTLMRYPPQRQNVESSFQSSRAKLKLGDLVNMADSFPYSGR